MENVENYTKEIQKMCKIPHFSHFNEIYSPLDVPLTPSGGLSCLCLTVVVLATPKEMFFANHLSPITIFWKKAFNVLIYRGYSA